MNWRRLAMGLNTVLGRRRQGWFIPYRYADTLPPAGGDMAYAALESRFRAHEAAFAGVLAAIQSHAPALRAIGQAPPPAPRWRQDWFPRLDAAAAYALVRAERPARIVEVGSGHSTRFLARAVADGGFPCRITAIDPAPRAALAGLPIEVIRQPLHAAGTAPFQALAPGDLLFIDSSHILMPGSDVDQLFGQVLPLLPAGVLVHIHDIFLPDGYPAAWAWRGYNEQLGVLALLQGNGFAVRFASHYVVSRMNVPEMAPILAELPLPDGGFESSLWLVKR